VSICLCCLSIAPAAARMYQWQNPATGTTQLSGTPPAWYRGADHGPRVFVFENNQLIDDTGIAVSAAQAGTLRAEAFGAAAVSMARDDAPASEPSRAPTRPAVAALPATPAPATENSAAAPTVNASTASRASALKALIDAWDQHQLDQARSLLDMMPADNGAPPARR
jgi:hypothetical protein